MRLPPSDVVAAGQGSQRTYGIPAASDVSAILGRSKSLGLVLCGECGEGLDASDGNAAGTQVAFVNGMGDWARDPRCFGANYFSTTSYYQGSASQSGSSLPADGYGYGLLKLTYDTPNMNIVTPMTRWPAL